MFFKSAIFTFTIGALFVGLWSCENCYENHEPKIFLSVYNTPNFQHATADEIISPISFSRQDSGYYFDNQSRVYEQEIELTLPLRDSVVTYKLPYVDELFGEGLLITFNYQLEKFFQSDRCGYVVKVNSISATTVSDLEIFRNDRVPTSIYENEQPFATYMVNSELIDNLGL